MCWRLYGPGLVLDFGIMLVPLEVGGGCFSMGLGLAFRGVAVHVIDASVLL